MEKPGTAGEAAEGVHGGERMIFPDFRAGITRATGEMASF
jgi:hypothetical protein